MARRFKTDDEVLDAFERELGRPASRGFWALMVADRYVDEARGGLLALADLVERYRQLERAAREPAPPRTESRALPPDQRLEVLAQLVAEQAAQDEWVRGFRDRHLGGKMLSVGEMRRWLLEQRDRDGPPTFWGEFPAIEEPGSGGQAWIPASDARVGSVHAKQVDCEADGGVSSCPDGTTAFVFAPLYLPATDGGVLDQLRRGVEDLAARTGWSRSDTTRFVLTGEPPSITRATCQLLPRRYGNLDVSRAVLTVHPTTSPSDLMGLYREARDGWFRRAGTPRRQRRAKRPLGTLVEFVQSRPNATWEDRRDTWNAMYTEYAYSAVTNMQRDYKRALNLATGGGRTIG